MNSKKTSSIILIVAMLITMFSFTALAAAPTLSLTYENATVGKNAGDAILSGDTFFAVIKLTDSDTLFGLRVELSYNNTIVNPVRTTGAVATSITNGSTDRASDVLKIYDDVDEVDVICMESLEGLINNAIPKIVYDCSAKVIQGNTNDYVLTPAEKASGLTIIKLRFKVIGTGNAGFTYSPTGNKLQPSKASANSVTTTGITPLTIPSAGYAVTYNLDGGIGGNATGYTASAIQTLPTVAPTKAGYTFVAWTINGSAVPAAGTAITAATEIKATWKLASVSVGTTPTEDVNYKTDKGVGTSHKPVKVVKINGKMPADVNAGNFANVEFGVVIGTTRPVYFRSTADYTTLSNAGNDGLFIIKLVNSDSDIAVGTVFQARNYIKFGAADAIVSDTSFQITVQP